MGRVPRLTKSMVDEFIESAMLSEDEIYILTSRMRGATVSEQALHLNKSEACVHKMIRRIKDKYDLVYAENPDRFPKRYKSDAEKYMDTH